MSWCLFGCCGLGGDCCCFLVREAMLPECEMHSLTARRGHGRPRRSLGLVGEAETPVLGRRDLMGDLNPERRGDEGRRGDWGRSGSSCCSPCSLCEEDLSCASDTWRGQSECECGTASSVPSASLTARRPLLRKPLQRMDDLRFAFVVVPSSSCCSCSAVGNEAGSSPSETSTRCAALCFSLSFSAEEALENSLPNFGRLPSVGEAGWRRSPSSEHELMDEGREVGGGLKERVGVGMCNDARTRSSEQRRDFFCCCCCGEQLSIFARRSCDEELAGDGGSMTKGAD